MGLYLSWQRLTVSLDRVSFIRQHPADYSHCQMHYHDGLQQPSIRIKQLDFTHVQQTIFNQADLTIPYGAKVVIGGNSGLGKSTLLDLLQRHLTPDKGCIMINQFNLSKIPLKQWRQIVAVAPQEPVIFSDSLRNNLTYGLSNTPTQQIVNAVKKAGLQTLLDQLPQGLDSHISEGGSNLSGGEKQRIGIARAILHNPQILILDEPTSAIDPHTENALLACIDQCFPGITRIIVSHKSNVFKQADIKVHIKHQQLQVVYA